MRMVINWFRLLFSKRNKTKVEIVRLVRCFNCTEDMHPHNDIEVHLFDGKVRYACSELCKEQILQVNREMFV